MRRQEGGFTLVEVLLALFLIGIGLLALAPLFVYATRSVAVSADLGDVGTKAVQRLEILRSQSFDTLPQGGNINTSQTGYFDSSSPDVIVRWKIENIPNTGSSPVTMKTITVRAVSTRTVLGAAKDVRMFTRRGR